MKNIMEIVKEYIINLSIIFLGTLITMTTYSNLIGREEIYTDMIWQALGVAMIFAGLQYIFYSKKPLSNRQILIRHVIHYASLVSVLMGSAYIFEWIDFNQTTLVIGLMAIFTVAYIGITSTFNFLEKREVDYINQKVEEYKRNKK